jgi:hypothetical protein
MDDYHDCLEIVYSTRERIESLTLAGDARCGSRAVQAK